MKKIIASLGAIALLMALSVPADAGSKTKLNVDIEKDKTVDVTETVTITKDVDIDVRVDVDLDAAAEANTLVNAEIKDNSVVKDGSGGLETLAKISNNAFKNATGIIQVNQAPGNMNNQGNAAAVAVVLGAGPAVTHSSVGEVDVNKDNEAYIYNTTVKDVITDSAFSGVVGVLSVNQAAGNMNNQHNSVAIAAGEAVVALSEADLGQVNADNFVEEIGTYKYYIINDNAFEGSHGVISVNQSAGNMNNQSNVVSISFIH